MREKDTTPHSVPAAVPMERATTATPPSSGPFSAPPQSSGSAPLQSSGSGSQQHSHSSPESDSGPKSGSQNKRPDKINTSTNNFSILLNQSPPSQGGADSATSASSPDGDADPEAVAEWQKIKTPFHKYPAVQRMLDRMMLKEKTPSLPNDYRSIAEVKRAQFTLLTDEIKKLDIEELEFFSLYLNSVQVDNSINRYFKTMRTETGWMGWFQSFGNTSTWQNLRSLVKDRLYGELIKSESPKKRVLPPLSYLTNLQIFQQHSGRYWFAFGKTRSEKRFLHEFCLPSHDGKDNASPSAAKVVKSHRK